MKSNLAVRVVWIGLLDLVLVVLVTTVIEGDVLRLVIGSLTIVITFVGLA